jgi:hypothetical protein
MAMPYFKRISSASISARWITGMWSLRASATSGLSAAMAELVTSTSDPGTFPAAWPSKITAPRLDKRWVMAEFFKSDPETR